MIPASLPICVFFTLYVLAAAGFFVLFEGIAGRDLKLSDPLVRTIVTGVLAVFWPLMATWLVFEFVKGRI